jgi:hypothetical protein
MHGSLICTCSRGICRPIALLAVPNLEVPVKSGSDGARAIGIGHDVVTAQWVSSIDGLDQWEFRICSRMHLDGWRP